MRVSSSSGTGRRLRPVLGVLVALAGTLLAAGCTAAGAQTPVTVTSAAPSGPNLAGGVVLDRPTPKPALTLTDTSGKPYDLRARTAGKVTILYFGYTHCDDICPATMADLATALRRVSPAVRRQVAVVFVTTDPARDTGPVLRQWLDRFSPSFVGLTGSFTQIADAQKAADVPIAKREKDPKAKGGYGVGHSAEVLVFTRDDRAHVVYLANDTANDYTADLPRLVGMWTS